MKDKLLKLSVNLKTLLRSEEGQDLIEYALIVAVIALGAVVGMKGLAGDINTAFAAVGGTLTSYTS